MSEYLLNIAARSAGNAANDLLPSTPVFNATDAEPINDFAEENNLQDSVVQNQTVEQNIVQVQPVPLQKVQPAVILNRTEITEQQKNMETSYFSKHVERVEAEAENSTVKTKPTETVSFKIEQPSEKTGAENAIGVENAIVKPVKKESAFVNKTVSKIIPEKKAIKKQPEEKEVDNISETFRADETISVKKQKINPAVEDENQKKNKLLPTILPIERITPNEPNQVNKISVQNKKMNEAAPKLVIGKIIVQMLPPKLPVPQKVITRVVQSSSKPGFSKSNKLSFGLGQL
jgi:hypothetical protein